MAAPTNAALVKKVLANSEPSTHGPSRHSATRQNLVAIGGIADIEPFSAGDHLQRMSHNGLRQPSKNQFIVSCRPYALAAP